MNSKKVKKARQMLRRHQSDTTFRVINDMKTLPLWPRIRLAWRIADQSPRLRWFGR